MCLGVRKVPFSWVFMATQGCSVVFMATHGCSWGLISTHVQPWVAMNTHMTLMNSHEHSWAWCLGDMNTTDQPWVAINTYEYGTLAPWALINTQECDIMVQWALLRTHGTISPYSWVLLSAHMGLCTFMSAHECSSTVLNIYWKMLILRMNTLQYLCNISVQISPNDEKLDIFKIYTKRAVGKCPRLIF